LPIKSCSPKCMNLAKARLASERLVANEIARYFRSGSWGTEHFGLGDFKIDTKPVSPFGS